MQIIVIVVIASAIGLYYNFRNPDGLPLIYKETIIKEADDSELGLDDTSDELDSLRDLLENAPLVSDGKGDGIVIHSPGHELLDQHAKEEEETNKRKKQAEAAAEIEKNKNSETIASEEPQTEDGHEVANYKNVTFTQVQKMIDNPNFIIIDARRDEEYEKAHIDNAINIFPYISEDVLFEKALQLPEDKRIIVYCEGGDCDSSHKLVQFLKDVIGLEHVYIYSDGWDDWISHQ